MEWWRRLRLISTSTKGDYITVEAGHSFGVDDKIMFDFTDDQRRFQMKIAFIENSKKGTPQLRMYAVPYVVTWINDSWFIYMDNDTYIGTLYVLSD